MHFGIYFGLCLISIVLSLLLYRAYKYKGCSDNKALLLSYIFNAALMMLLSIFLLEPGGLDDDIVYQIDKAARGFWGDLHPHGLAMAFWLTGKLMLGTIPLLIIQIMLFATGVVGIFAMSNPKSVKQNIILSSLMFFSHVSFNIFGMLYKDMLNGALYVFAAFLAICFHKLESKLYRAIVLYACIILLSYGVFVCLNAPIAALPIVLFLFWPYIARSWKLIFGAIILTIISGFVLHKIHDKFSDERYFLTELGLRRYELAYIAYKTSRVELLDTNTWAAGLSSDNLEEIYGNGYYPSFYDARTHIWSQGSLYKYFSKLKEPRPANQPVWAKEVSKRCFYAVSRYPLVYLKFKAYNALGALGIGMEPQCQAHSSDPEIGNRFGFRAVLNPIAFEFWKNHVGGMHHSFLMTPWIYFFISILLMIFIYFFAIPIAGFMLTLTTSSILMQAGCGQ